MILKIPTMKQQSNLMKQQSNLMKQPYNLNHQIFGSASKGYKASVLNFDQGHVDVRSF